TLVSEPFSVAYVGASVFQVKEADCLSRLVLWVGLCFQSDRIGFVRGFVEVGLQGLASGPSLLECADFDQGVFGDLEWFFKSGRVDAVGLGSVQGVMDAGFADGMGEGELEWLAEEGLIGVHFGAVQGQDEGSVVVETGFDLELRPALGPQPGVLVGDRWISAARMARWGHCR